MDVSNEPDPVLRTFLEYSNKLVVAIHEAGHAVAEVEYGWSCGALRILKSDAYPGAWDGNAPSDPPSRNVPFKLRHNARLDRYYWPPEKEAERLVGVKSDHENSTILAAGLAATCFVFGEDHVSTGHWQDDKGILECAQRQRRTDEGQRAYVDAAHARAAKIFTLQRCQRALIALGGALVTREEIPGDEAEAIIRSQLKRPRQKRR